MFNLPPLHSTKAIDVKVIPAVLQTWQIGQIFESRAKTSSNAQGEFLLQIGQHLINAKIKTPVQAGEAFTLQVTKLGQEPILKILNQPIKTDSITLYLRQAVPQSHSIQKLVNLINRVQHLVPLPENAQTAGNLSDKAVTSAITKSMDQTAFKSADKMTDKVADKVVDKVVNKILDKTVDKVFDKAAITLSAKGAETLQNEAAIRPSPQAFDLKVLSQQLQTLAQVPLKAEHISPENIQRFLQQSGFDFENKLLKSNEIPVKDLKFQLLQLKQTIDQVLVKSQDPSLIKNPERISTIAAEYRLPALANYLLYGIPAADKASIISFIAQPTGFNSHFINNNQSFVFQAVQKLNTKEMSQLKQWIQFIPSLAEIRQLIEQSINTITNHQLQALQVEADADSAFLVLFNLLLSKNTDWIDLFNIKISKQDADEDKHWSVTIQLEIAGLGLVEAKLVLVKKQLHAGLTSESNVTHLLINEHLHLLQSALTQAGFDVATLSSRHDKIQPIDQQLPKHGPLLEDQA
ncbi:MAG: flagellar hook-length control protein FliK [Gammaproteobacteria bacterium]|nr:flagellar hook-length control protein FliK [Gammaproteobacteria bacterium]